MLWDLTLRGLWTSLKKKRKTKKRRAKRILGNDRGLMFICKDIRRRWCQYGMNRKGVADLCEECGTNPTVDVDHIVPMGPRPRTFEALGEYARRMFETDCQGLCKECHGEKTAAERERRKTK